MTILSDIIAGELGGRGAAALVERTPVPETPSAQVRRPTPGAMADPQFPAGYRSPSSTDVQPATPFDRSGDDEGGSISGTGYPVTQGRGPVFDISVVTPMSSARRAEIDSRNQRLDVQFGQGLIGMKDIYNPATGRYAASAPKMGVLGLPLFGAFAMAGDAFMKKKQKEAALSAAMGNENSGVIMVNDSVIAVVDGKIYGNTPDHIPRHQAQNAIRDFVRNTPASKKSGDYYDISQGGLGKIPLPQSPEEQNRPIIPPPPPPPPPPAAPFYEAGRDPAPQATQYSISGGAGTSQKPGGFSMRAEGGRVGMADGGSADPVQRTGFVEGSPDNYAKGDTVADTVKTQVRENSFVLNAPTVERLQEAGLLPKGVDNSDKKTTIKAKKGGLMDVALSKGEYVIEPEEAQRIGYSFLEKINDQGKAEVDRRQAAADGGFINGYQEGGKTLPTVLPQPSPVRQAYVGEDIDRPEIPLTDNMIAQFKVYNSSKKQRKDVENLINALNDRENLALVALAETTAEKDDIEAMMGVQTTVLNRVKSKGVKLPKYPIVRRDFTEATDVKSALKQRTPGRGSGSFMFQYDGFEPKFLSPKIDSILKGQVPEFAITKIMASSANVLDPEAQFGEGLFPDTVTFYTREDAPLAKDMELNPQMRYVTTLGGHDFYSYEAAPESPDEEKIYKEYLAEKRKKKKN